MSKLTQKQQDQLWGVDGPYSEAKLIIETRILDDSVSRVFINVEVAINPFTYRLIKKHRKKFKDDLMIQQLLNHVDYRGQAYGYVSCAFRSEYINDEVLLAAQEHLEYAKQAIIKMHKFVMVYLGEEDGDE